MTVETLSKAYEINLEIQKVKEKIKECQYLKEYIGFINYIKSLK